jgi:hypothetical protein
MNNRFWFFQQQPGKPIFLVPFPTNGAVI